MRNARFWLGLGLLASAVSLARAEDAAGPNEYRHQITGLFAKDRVAALERVFAKISTVKLVKVDFETAEAVLEYDREKVYGNATPEQIVERLNNEVRGASQHTLGVKPLCAVPREQLVRVEIPVYGLDCKACELAAYEAVYQLAGVESATVSFRDNLLVARIHEAKVQRKQLEDALRSRGVTLEAPGER